MWLVQARGHVDDAHLSANVTQLDLKNMAVSPQGGRASSPIERINHAVMLSSWDGLAICKAKAVGCRCCPSELVTDRQHV